MTGAKARIAAAAAPTANARRPRHARSAAHARNATLKCAGKFDRLSRIANGPGNRAPMKARPRARVMISTNRDGRALGCVGVAIRSSQRVRSCGRVCVGDESPNCQQIISSRLLHRGCGCNRGSSVRDRICRPRTGKPGRSVFELHFPGEDGRRRIFCAVGFDQRAGRNLVEELGGTEWRVVHVPELG